MPNKKTRKVKDTKDAIVPFVSLFCPQNDAFQKLFQKVGRQQRRTGMSDFLIRLIVNDLYARRLITKDQYAEYVQYVQEDKPRFNKTRLDASEDHRVFALYVPPRLAWLRDALSPKKVKERCKAKNRSSYVWGLFTTHSEQENSFDNAA